MSPPKTEVELVARARELSGLRLADIAAQQAKAVPADLRHAKGWAGALLESALGASAGPRAMPDFPELGVELKTLPVDRRGRPVETTFVCTIDLNDIVHTEWEQSRLLSKLRRVLWVPIEGERQIPPGQRRVGSPLLWSPSPSELEALRADWEELSGLIGCGQLEAVTGHLGQHLQVRPKARNASARRWGSDSDGSPIRTLPRGFYLRTQFTEAVLRRHFVMPQS